jgi:hypothetical protein
VNGTAAALVVIGASAALATALALMCDARRRARHLHAENKRLTGRLVTFTRVLAPLPDALRAGRNPEIPHTGLVALALLVEQEGPEGDVIAGLEVLLRETPDL